MPRRKQEEPLYAVGDYITTLEPSGDISGQRTGRYRRGRVEHVMPDDNGCGVSYIIKLTPHHSIVSKHCWMKRGRKFDMRRVRHTKEEREVARILRGVA